MTNALKTLIPAFAGVTLTLGCSSGRTQVEEGGATTVVQAPIKQSGVWMSSRPLAMPKTTLYKTSGNYADNVPIQVDAQGSLISFPDPSDIPADAAVVSLNQGWLLNPIGITAQSVFTRYTYDEYRQLKQVPSTAELLEAIIPGAKVTATMSIDMPPAEALADTAAVNKLIPTVKFILK